MQNSRTNGGPGKSKITHTPAVYMGSIIMRGQDKMLSVLNVAWNEDVAFRRLEIVLYSAVALVVVYLRRFA